MQVCLKRLMLRFLPCMVILGPLWAHGQDPETVARQMLQERGEVIIRFEMPPGTGLEALAAFLSVDRLRNDTVVAYANTAGFNIFLKLGLPFDVVYPPSLQYRRGILPAGKKDDWRSRYPGYVEYEQLLEQFSSDHPDICRLVQFGTSVNGHKLLALRITDNPGTNEKEPVVLYSSSMHGDEVTGYALMLRFVDEVLTLYAFDEQIKRLVDNVDIWINPLANPDGTYFLSDASVAGATRFNANNIDLNRDFPSPDDPEWESRERQPETQAMMDLLTGLRPVLAANFHGGAEVVNYPWDTWERLHADNDWYRHLSRAYADTVHAYATPGYMNDLDNGITNGYMWYTLYGGRQDYTNYYLRGREVTIELSYRKTPPDSSLDDYWNFNRKSLMHFIGRSMTGVTGDVTDSVTGSPVEALISIENHDADHSEPVSSPITGRFYRLTGPGNYPLAVAATGYRTKRFTISVSEGTLSRRDIRLQPLEPLVIYPNPFTDVLHTDILEPGGDLILELFDMAGRKVRHLTMPVMASGSQILDLKGLTSGTYVAKITHGAESSRQVVIRLPE